MAINSVIIEGNLCRDAEAKVCNGGTVRYSFTIAYNSGYGDNKQVHYFNVVAFAKSEAQINYYRSILTKGTKLVISGTLTYSKWEDTEGKTKSKTEIIARDICSMQKNTAQTIQVADDDIPF